MQAYFDMIREVLTHGTRKENRTGVDTLSTFNFNYELCWDEAMYGQTLQQPQADRRFIIDAPGRGEGFAMPLLTTKNVSWKNIAIEMLWFLSGEPSLEILRRHGCKFWDDWADENGRVPSAYGNFWRQFPDHVTRTTLHSNLKFERDAQGKLQQTTPWDEVEGYEDGPRLETGFNDQIKWVLDELRRNPMSRRLVVSAWAPGNAQTSKLPPCHMLFAFNVQNVKCPSCDDGSGWVAKHGFSGAERDACPRDCQGKTEQRLCLHLTQRSADLALGVPYNIASYALLLLIFSHLTGIKPGIFAHTLLDLHIYTRKPDGSMADLDHVPGLKEQLERVPRGLPRLVIDPQFKELSDIEALMNADVSTEHVLEKFALKGYDPHPAIKFKVAV